MPTYKDVDEIRKEILQGKKNLHFKNAENAEICAGVLAFVQGVIDRVPVADVEPVKHGYWEELDEEGCYSCSACGNPWIIIDGTPQDNEMYFCPNCGAKMDGDDNDP